MTEFNSLWIGNGLTKIEILAIKSFKNQIFNLYTYNNLTDGLRWRGHEDLIPMNCKIKDANEIIDKSEIFTYKNGSYAAFSNIFRFTVLYLKGGIWVDMDVINIRKINNNEKYIIVSECDITYKKTNLGCSVLKIPQNDPILLDAIDFCKSKKNDIISGKMKWGLGPMTMNYIVTKYSLWSYVKYWWYNNAYCCHHFNLLIDPLYEPIKNKDINTMYYFNNFNDIPEDTYFIHLFNEFFIKNKIDKNMIFDKCTFIGQLYENII